MEQQVEVERNKAVVRRFIEEIQNQKDWAKFDELNAPDFVNLTAPPGMPSDREGGKAYLTAFVNTFPDSHITIDDMIAEGDRVATKKDDDRHTQASSTGSHRQGRSSRFSTKNILRLRDGQTTVHWLSMDQLSFMQQQG